MGHNICIDENTGKASVFVVKEPAWHGLGQVVQEALTAEEAIIQAGLDWNVVKTPIHYSVDGKQLTVDNKFAIIRNDNNKALGIVGKDYVPVQNREAFSFFDALVNEKEAIYHSAGALGVGERVWVLAKLPTDIVIGKDDLVKNYALITNAHDASGVLMALMTPTRVVCNNTLTAALHHATNKVLIRHTKNVHENIKQAHELLGLSNRFRVEIQNAFNFLSSKQITEKVAATVLDDLFSFTDDEGKVKRYGTKIKENILNIYGSSVGGQDMPTCRGTAFGLYNAVSFYYDNARDYKNNDRRASSTWFGGAAKVRQRAFNKILQEVS